MKTLITAHPSVKGFTHKIAKTFAKSREKKGGKAEIIDLYQDEKYQQPFLKFEEIKGEWSGAKPREIIQKKIIEADELVFVYPTWWSAMPAIMKNFIDNNFTARFAFTYESGKPMGLLKNKIVRIFSTADAPWIMYFIMNPFLKMTIGKAIFGFCGMKVKSFDIFTEMRKKDNKDKEKLLEKVRNRV